MTELLASTKDLVAEVRRLAAERPDYVYRDTHSECFYVEHCENDVTGGDFWADPEELFGSCIVGQACLNLGVDKLAFKYHNNQPFSYFWHKLFEENSIIDNKDIVWLQKVQFRQDNKDSWGVAVKNADDMLHIDSTPEVGNPE